MKTIRVVEAITIEFSADEAENLYALASQGIADAWWSEPKRGTMKALRDLLRDAKITAPGIVVC